MRIFAITLLALTASCITQPPSGAVHPRHSLVDRVAEPPVRCVPRLPRAALLVLEDSRTLSYRYGNIVYRTEVQSACPGLRPQSSIVVESIGGRYCSGDRIRVVDPGAPGHICAIGPFTPYRLAR